MKNKTAEVLRRRTISLICRDEQDNYRHSKIKDKTLKNKSVVIFAITEYIITALALFDEIDNKVLAKRIYSTCRNLHYDVALSRYVSLKDIEVFIRHIRKQIHDGEKSTTCERCRIGNDECKKKKKVCGDYCYVLFDMDSEEIKKIFERKMTLKEKKI